MDWHGAKRKHSRWGKRVRGVEKQSEDALNAEISAEIVNIIDIRVRSSVIVAQIRPCKRPLAIV